MRDVSELHASTALTRCFAFFSSWMQKLQRTQKLSRYITALFLKTRVRSTMTCTTNEISRAGGLPKPRAPGLEHLRNTWNPSTWTRASPGILLQIFCENRNKSGQRSNKIIQIYKSCLKPLIMERCIWKEWLPWYQDMSKTAALQDSGKLGKARPEYV